MIEVIWMSQVRARTQALDLYSKSKSQIPGSMTHNVLARRLTQAALPRFLGLR